MTERHEPTTWQIQASYKNKQNTALARAIFPLITFGTYDRYAAHRWALKLISSNPATGEEVATSLTNFEYMIEGARAQYNNSPRRKREMDEVASIFTAWKAKEEVAA